MFLRQINIKTISILQISMLLVCVLGCSGNDTLPGERIVDQGRDHILPEDTHVPYESMPATSGPHYTHPYAPAPWGIYDLALPDEVVVHNLEHGGVGVYYACPNGCPDLVDELTSVVNDALIDGLKVIMLPYPNMGSTISLVAWNFIDKLEHFDQDRIELFINAHESSPNAPEYMAR